MRINYRSVTATLLASALALGGVATRAGTAEMTTGDGDKMQFEYRGDDLLRVNMQEGNYMLVLDDQVYMVSNSEGQLMVISLSQAMGMFGGMAGAATPSAVGGKLLSLRPQGRKETVAGIQGEVYEVRFIDQDGRERTGELVLSKDPRAVELQQAMFNMARNMARAANRELEGQEELERELGGMQMGVLRYDQDMRVTAISDQTVDKARFALPAEPTDMSAMQGMFGGAGQPGTGGAQGQSGGMMSGILGAFGKQGQDQQQESAEDEEKEQEESAESGMDTMKKAFGNLFGK